MWVTFLATPKDGIAAMLSPPPIIDVALLFATYFAKEFNIPMEKIHSTRLNDKIEINKNKGEKDD